MYDHLDDNDPPAPGAAERSRVVARARQRKQRRVATVSSASAVLVLALGLGVAGLDGSATSDTAPQLLSPSPTGPTGSPSTTPSPRTTPTAPASATGAPRAPATGAPTSAVASRSPVVTRAPSSPACAATPTSACPDGLPGWTGPDACTPWSGTFAAASREVTPGLAASLALPSVVTGTSFTATLTFTNEGDRDLEVRAAADNLGLLLLQGGEVDASYGDDRALVVAAGESASLELDGSTRACGDTPAQGRIRIPAGERAAGVRLQVTVDAVEAAAEPTEPVLPSVGTPTPARTRLVTEQEVSLGGTLTVR